MDRDCRPRLPRRQLVTILALPLALAACGWEPLYADRQAPTASAELRAIHVDPIPDRIGQRLEIALRDALNPQALPSPVRYTLHTTLIVTRADLGLVSQGLATRGKLDVSANYTLTDRHNGRSLLTGIVHSTIGFDISPNEYATVVAEDDARNRTIAEVADEILTRLTLFMQRRAGSASKLG